MPAFANGSRIEMNLEPSVSNLKFNHHMVIVHESPYRNYRCDKQRVRTKVYHLTVLFQIITPARYLLICSLAALDIVNGYTTRDYTDALIDLASPRRYSLVV